MAAYSSSSPSSPRNHKYDVFLSFRGEDTRDNFTSHLYSALSQKGIEAFIDDQLNRGDEISQSLLDAIEASAISQRFKENSEKLQTWRNALKEAADLSGFHSQNIRPESELVREVVNQILKRLAEVSPCSNKNPLVGVESRVEEIESLLGAESKDVYALGIWGIGGIGKTTIARAIFNNISSNFEGSCFLQNVREESQRPGGLGCLQQKLLSKLLQDHNVIPDIALSFRRLSSRKFLIVLDDVTCFKQIKSLIRMLRNCCVKEKYEMKELVDDFALELFRFEELSSRVINYAQGVPLAIEILVVFYSKRKNNFGRTLRVLHLIHVLMVWMMTRNFFFLDIACFFKWKNEHLVIKFLNACGFTAQIGISSLVVKSLICIHGNNITMHDLLQEMGWEIVRQESMNDLGKRSWLWHHEDSIKFLTSNAGRILIEGICLGMSKGPVFTEVRYFHWHGCPLKSLPSNIHLEKLVLLEMPHSNIQQLLDSVRGFVLNLRDCKSLKSLPAGIYLEFLKELDLLNGTAIEEQPSTIECLYKLFGLCKLKLLKYLTLNGCSNLQRLPDELRNLETLWKVLSSVFHLNNIDLLSFQRSGGHKQMGLSLPITLSLNGLRTLRKLDLQKNNFERIPESVIQLSKLGRLCLRYWERLQSLPKLPCKLHELDAHHCTALESLSGLFSSFEARTQYFDLISVVHIYYSKKYALLGRVFLLGNEILMWFGFQSMKSSITLKMLSGWFGNKKVLGFAFSAIVAFGDHHVREKRWFELFCEFKVKPKDSHVIQRFMGMVDYVESDHLLLGYYFFDDPDLNGFWKYNCILEALQFYFKEDFYRAECLECCLVKKCGTHLLYAPDSTKSTDDPSGFFYHNHEEEQHPKRLKYS
ncbi:Disease resistance-like protein DSC1 [Citrus sinensis]|uniref:Disease resistance-like protein DSC1 n=1 Tax=Citrus sinensis TaxID=2711 RepID=A0ACB8MA54_CITSI|nr:Disease resistance-like protein DSC1 [Citrus sinensis]